MERRFTFCPHCESAAKIRSSHQLTPVYREITLMCSNPNCGHTFVAGLEVVRTLSPSATPRPGLNIPMASHVRQRDLFAGSGSTGSTSA